MHTLILASASPRRKELLEQIGIEPVIRPCGGEEKTDRQDPAEAAADLADAKCRNAAELFRQEKTLTPGLFFLGADTIVVKDGSILGKPKSAEDAEEMLAGLQGAWHQVFTGVSLMRIDREGFVPAEFSEGYRRFSVCTEVCVAPMSREEIRDYVKTGDPLDKAGAYGIQGLFARHISAIRGEYANVVGLPVAEVYSNLNEMHFFL